MAILVRLDVGYKMRSLPIRERLIDTSDLGILSLLLSKEPQSLRQNVKQVGNVKFCYTKRASEFQVGFRTTIDCVLTTRNTLLFLDISG